jgi:hypothetical protein
MDGNRPKLTSVDPVPDPCPIKGITARQKPIKRLPESPMNIFAVGIGKLNNRNPTTTPAMHKQTRELH